MQRTVMVFHHASRPETKQIAQQVSARLQAAGVGVVDKNSNEPVELIVVLGGDGTILSAAEYARPLQVPILGINLGHVGFLAEAEEEEIAQVVRDVVAKNYSVETRLTLEVQVDQPGGGTQRSWALNEAVVAGIDKRHPALMTLGVDGEAVSEYGTDGLIISTPTGSTAYAFSVGGPVVWPDVQALVVAPLAAHGLFTRPLVVGPNSRLEVQVASDTTDCEVWCDGRRIIEAPAGSFVQVVVGAPISLARLKTTPFSARLVAKFSLPTSGWRSQK